MTTIAECVDFEYANWSLASSYIITCVLFSGIFFMRHHLINVQDFINDIGVFVQTCNKVGNNLGFQLITLSTMTSRTRLGAVVFLALYVTFSALSGWLPFPANNQNSVAVTLDRNLSYEEALDESYGYFDDITNEQWARKKSWLKQMEHSQEIDGTFQGDEAITRAYTNHWNPDFACPFSAAVGPVGDGHKWTCDPHRLRTIDDCLVYSVGSFGKFGFEEKLLEIAPNCEVHIFDPADYTASMQDTRINASYHAWGLASTSKFAADVKNLKSKNRDSIMFKDINEIRRLLNHESRTIHVFKIDCEGCEWETYLDWLYLDIRQVQVETHGWNKGSLKFFEDMREAGYAMFSKEANTLARGTCMEFSFIKLKQSFFK